MGQTLFDEPSLSGFKSRLQRGGGGGLFGAWDQALPAAASDGTITECRKPKFKTD